MTEYVNKLFLGDCLSVMDDFILNNVKVNYVFTSPPYNRKRNDKYANFEDVNLNYYDFLCNVVNRCLVLADYLFLNIQHNYYNKADVFKLIGNYNENIIDVVIWEKRNPMPASGRSLTNSYEYIIILSKTKKIIHTNTTYMKNHITTSVYSNNPYSKIHRAVMNPNVASWFINTFTKEGDIVLDCFMGLGTTALACMQANRKFIGIENCSEYFEIAQNRIKGV